MTGPDYTLGHAAVYFHGTPLKVVRIGKRANLKAKRPAKKVRPRKSGIERVT